nr:ankyrin repeat domain-containing protein [Algoriphagus sp.]
MILHESACLGELDGVKLSLSQNPTSINDFSADGFTALGLAAYFGHSQLVNWLLLQGANPSLPSANPLQVTPLHSACANSHFEITKLLIHHQADVNAKQQHGVTPLHSAAHNNDRDLVQFLIDKGADLQAKMDNGKTPKDLARESGCSDLFENLE